MIESMKLLNISFSHIQRLDQRQKRGVTKLACE